MRRESHSVFAVATLPLLFAIITFTPPAAGAYDYDPNFWLVTGRTFTDVNAAVVSGNLLYVGGSFDQIGMRTGSTARIDGATGALVPGWPMTDGSISAFASDGLGGWFIGGTFTRVGGLERNKLARIRSDMTVDPWNPGTDGKVRKLVRSGGTLYIGGEFATVGGLARRAIAAVDIASGAVTPWSIDLPRCAVMTIAVSGTTVYFGGTFQMVGSQLRYGVAAVHTASGALLGWNPILTSNSWVYALAIDGSTVYLSGSFTTVRSQPRNGLASVDAVTAEPTSWNHSVDGGVLEFQMDASKIFVIGNFHNVDGVLREGIAAFESATGILSTWYPGACHDLWACVVQGGRVYISGGFTTAGGVTRPGLAAIDATTAAVTDWNPGPNDAVSALAGDGVRILVGGRFSSIGTISRHSLAALDVTTNQWTSWAPVEDFSGISAVVVGADRIYVAGYYRPVAGSTRAQIRAIDSATGTQTFWQVDLNALETTNGFALELVNNTLYVGGAFTLVQGQPRTYLAALDATTGALLPWNPVLNVTQYFGGVSGLEAYQGLIYAAGNFGSVNGLDRGGVAALDPITGATTPWDAHVMPGRPNRVQQIDGLMFLGGGFTRVGGQERIGIASVSATTGAVTAWGTGPGAFEVTSFQKVGSELYVAGYLRYLDQSTYMGMGVMDLETGLPSAWKPVLQSGTVQAMAIADGWAYLGGRFDESVDGFTQDVCLQRMLLPVPGPEAPVVHLLSPNGGEAVFTYEPITFTWTATHSVGVASVDLYISRTGPTGPWEALAVGIPNTGSWTWIAMGAASNYDAYVYIVAHDGTGATGRDRNDAGFGITTSPVPTLVELFRLEDGADGVTIRWVADERASFTPQRGESESGGWTNIGGVPRTDGRERVVLDREAESGAVNWYRLTGTAADGRTATVAPLSIRHAVVTSLALDGVAPNPTRASTQVSFSLPASARVQLALVDVQGRTVATLSDGERGAGRHVARLDVGDLPAGLYFLRLNAGGTELRQRVVVVP